MKRTAFGGLGLVALFALTACAEAAPSGDPASTELPTVDLTEQADVSVLVDEDSGSFIFPIDAYLMDVESMKLVAQANDVLFRDCVVAGGGSYTVEEPADPGPPVADRRYGLWDVEQAAAFGYSLSPGGNTADPTQGDGGGGDVDFELMDACANETDFLPSVGRGTLAADGVDPEFYLAADIMSTASQLAQADERWAAADEAWRVCLEGAGLQVVRDVDGIPLRPVVPEDPEQSLRSAVQEAECSVSTDRVQTLGDLESQYQAALIEEQQSALNASLEEQKSIVAEAKAIVDNK